MRYSLAIALLVLIGCGDESGGPEVESEKAAQPVPPIVLCKMHLQNLHGAMTEYENLYGQLPWTTGAQFWVTFSLTNPPIISGSELAWYNCPVSPGMPGPGQCEYRGPNGNANTWLPGDVIGADGVGAHGVGQGGHVLLRDGTVLLVAETSPLWIIAQTKTTY
jgi:hypothetical protein